MLELRKEALPLNANAVIAVDLDYSEFSGSGKSMLFLVASGRAVKVEKKMTADDLDSYGKYARNFCRTWVTHLGGYYKILLIFPLTGQSGRCPQPNTQMT